MHVYTTVNNNKNIYLQEQQMLPLVKVQDQYTTLTVLTQRTYLIVYPVIRSAIIQKMWGSGV